MRKRMLPLVNPSLVKDMEMTISFLSDFIRSQKALIKVMGKNDWVQFKINRSRKIIKRFKERIKRAKAKEKEATK